MTEAMAPIPLIVNPAAGGGHGRRAGEEAERVLQTAGVHVTAHVSGSADEAAELATEAVQSGAPVLFVCGGDGSVHMAANALAHSAVALGIIPAGRGNDLARALGLPLRPRAAARVLANLIVNGQAPLEIDLGEANGRFFCSVATFGIDSAVSRRVHESGPGRSTRFAYVAATLIELFRYRPQVICVEGDFGRRSFRALLCATANTPNYGGAYRIAPDARLDDGRFHVCMIGAMSPLRALALMPRVMAGTHLSHPHVEMVQTRTLSIDTDFPAPLYGDGEHLTDTPARLRVAPRALRVLAPSRVSAV